MVSAAATETIGQRIRRERSSRAMTQRRLAELAGVGTPHISKIETGRENPSNALLERLGAVFGVDHEELMLTARRLPEGLLDRLAADPCAGLRALRDWQPTPSGSAVSQLGTAPGGAAGVGAASRQTL